MRIHGANYYSNRYERLKKEERASKSWTETIKKLTVQLGDSVVDDALLGVGVLYRWVVVRHKVTLK